MDWSIEFIQVPFKYKHVTLNALWNFLWFILKGKIMCVECFYFVLVTAIIQLLRYIAEFWLAVLNNFSFQIVKPNVFGFFLLLNIYHDNRLTFQNTQRVIRQHSQIQCDYISVKRTTRLFFSSSSSSISVLHQHTRTHIAIF